MKPTPDELIEDLRELADISAMAVWPDIPVEEVVEWEAADFIEAAVPVLTEIAKRDNDLGRRAKALLVGDYPATKPERDSDED